MNTLHTQSSHTWHCVFCLTLWCSLQIPFFSHKHENRVFSLWPVFRNNQTQESFCVDERNTWKCICILDTQLHVYTASHNPPVFFQNPAQCRRVVIKQQLSGFISHTWWSSSTATPISCLCALLMKKFTLSTLLKNNVLTDDSLPLAVGLSDLVHAAHLAVSYSTNDEDNDPGARLHLRGSPVLVPVTIASTARWQTHTQIQFPRKYWNMVVFLKHCYQC